MHESPLPWLTNEAMLKLARRPGAPADCDSCAPLVCPGWESMPGAFERSRLRRVGTLRIASEEEATLQEYHPRGTHGWSPDAPIAPAFFPYNRCDVWLCANCERPFLRYTEYGGYYEDERIRELKADLVVDVQPTA
jgi:hypothetical protein